jgi:cellulose synthase/poly-beta-1,6-N-acetylglucosamine synthase-like glycosyltransferase
MLVKSGTALAEQRRRWEYGRIAVRRRMLGPIIRTAQLNWPQKALAIEELTSHPTSHLALFYLFLLIAAFLVVPDLYLKGQYIFMGAICLSHLIATFALVVHGLSPFIATLIPWRFAASFLYFPYYTLWKLLVLAKGVPQNWIPTEREDKSSTKRMDSDHLKSESPAPADTGDECMRGARV